jgi:Tol biopolymer transport system component
MRLFAKLLFIALMIVVFLVNAIQPSAAAIDATPTPSSRATGQIAFTSNRDGNFEIYVMNADGSNVRRLTDNSASDGQYGIAWSPDGKKLVFSSNRLTGSNDNFQLFEMDADGSNAHLLNSSYCGCYPAFSPDGKRIAFAGFTYNFEIFVMDSDGSHAVNLTQSKDKDFNPAWSPDGRSILFETRRDGQWDELYVMNVDGSNQRRLTVAMDAWDGHGRWSPDGRQILFSAYHEGDPAQQIYIMNADGSKPRRLTKSKLNLLNPLWSPDGRYIVYTQDMSIETPTVDLQMFIMNADGTNIQQLTFRPGFNHGFSSIAWTRFPARVIATPSKTPTITPTPRPTNTLAPPSATPIPPTATASEVPPTLTPSQIPVTLNPILLQAASGNH